MKSSLAPHRLLAILAAFCASVALGQNATFSSDTTVLAAEGGTVTLTAVVNYDDAPDALAWSIALPPEWMLACVSGPNVPAITPEAGTTGVLEFAFTAVPARRAEFAVQVRYPVRASAAKAVPTVLFRTGGKLSTLKPAPIELTAGADSAAPRSRD